MKAAYRLLMQSLRGYCSHLIIGTTNCVQLVCLHQCCIKQQLCVGSHLQWSCHQAIVAVHVRFQGPAVELHAYTDYSVSSVNDSHTTLGCIP